MVFTCDNCFAPLDLRFITADNANRGEGYFQVISLLFSCSKCRWLITNQCWGTSQNPHRFYRWLRDVAPHYHTTLSNHSELHLSQPVATFTSPLSTQATSMAKQCAHVTCASPRVSASCPGGFCAKHCRTRLAGPCSYHSKGKSAPVPAAPLLLPSAQASSSQIPNSLPTFTPTPPTSTLSPQPIHATQMCPIASVRYQEVMERCSAREVEIAQRQEVIARAKSTVTLCAWVEVSALVLPALKGPLSNVSYL